MCNWPPRQGRFDASIGQWSHENISGVMLMARQIVHWPGLVGITRVDVIEVRRQAHLSGSRKLGRDDFSDIVLGDQSCHVTSKSKCGCSIRTLSSIKKSQLRYSALSDVRRLKSPAPSIQRRVLVCTSTALASLLRHWKLQPLLLPLKSGIILAFIKCCEISPNSSVGQKRTNSSVWPRACTHTHENYQELPHKHRHWIDRMLRPSEKERVGVWSCHSVGQTSATWLEMSLMFVTIPESVTDAAGAFSVGNSHQVEAVRHHRDQSRQVHKCPRSRLLASTGLKYCCADCTEVRVVPALPHRSSTSLPGLCRNIDWTKNQRKCKKATKIWWDSTQVFTKIWQNFK